MDLRRGLQHEYGRRRGGDGGAYGALPSSSGRAIPPAAVPSLSTGQGFYTVESLQGATMVPPPQPAPPPPRLLPPRDLPPHRLHPAERADFGPFDRRYPPPPAVGRKMMMMPPPELTFARRGEGLRGPGMLHHHPPPPRHFMGDPRMPGFLPGRGDPTSRSAWGPGDFDRHARDRSRPSQRIKAKKQGQKTAKPVFQAKSPSKDAAADRKSSADKQNSVEGGPGWCAICKIECGKGDSLKMHIAGKRHKKQVESQMQVDKSSDKAEESREEGGAMATASEEAAGKATDINGDEQDKTIAGKDGELDHESVETMAVDAPKGEGKSETAIAGKKRVLKEAVNQKKKSRKSAASSDAPNVITATAVIGAEDANEVQKTCDPGIAKKPAPDAHVKGADHVSSLKSEGDGNEPPTSEDKPLEEIIKESEDGSKEVRDVTDLENGRAGQSAEIQ